jgi:hypothetical protein
MEINVYFLVVLCEKFEDTKGVIRKRKSNDRTQEPNEKGQQDKQ